MVITSFNMKKNKQPLSLQTKGIIIFGSVNVLILNSLQPLCFFFIPSPHSQEDSHRGKTVMKLGMQEKRSQNKHHKETTKKTSQ